MLQRLAHSALRSSISLNNRTFSMAITAWSAKVLSRRLLSVKGRTSSTDQNSPIATPSRSKGSSERSESTPVRKAFQEIRPGRPVQRS